ncbi:hypothetical protein FEF26_04310 [Nesterenkonia salmonea]|uniref:Uncharacterized protein n=1 Tax=Nesterenkonia salmonea TaxID=1804987 RepID=A0A5R9BDB9_9MICC|nr:hypothetical protein [Nesterenkonia salmonea]TLP98627.1 hypothetical protein FEF26_04310 [Nesterenkonia salmonea]
MLKQPAPANWREPREQNSSTLRGRFIRAQRRPAAVAGNRSIQRRSLVQRRSPAEKAMNR